mmetsp:Transcript_270/g.370  ORF Transcript_270/g.370 Transcript_270/m.370 type:complete len:242 (+) Transcript_270:56-781(+)
MAKKLTLDERKDFGSILSVAGFYCALSGVVNGIALSELGSPVGYTSGACVNGGRFLAQGNMANWWKTFGAAINFYSAGILAGVTGSSCDSVFEGHISFGMLLSASLLALGTLCKRNLNRPILALQLWAFSQGLLNAITTKFSAVPIRATHTAGGMTDAALTIGQTFVAMSKGQKVPSMRKVVLNAVCCVAFTVGGFGSVRSLGKVGSLAGYQCAAALAASAVVLPPILSLRSEEEEKCKST